MSDIVRKELKRAVDNLESRRLELDEEMHDLDRAIFMMSDMIEKMTPVEYPKLQHATQVIRDFFNNNMEKPLTSKDVVVGFQKYVDRGQFVLKKSQKISALVHNSLFTLSEQQKYIEKVKSDNPEVDWEYIRRNPSHLKSASR